MKVNNLIYLFAVLLSLSCSKSNDASLGRNGAGKAGSLARFALVGDHMYAVTLTDLKILDIVAEDNPIYKGTFYIGADIETIFPLEKTLFIGSETGMSMFDVNEPLNPKRISRYTHIRSCDPVVANDKLAFVTLSTNSTSCSRGVNQLDIVDIQDKEQPKLLRTYTMVKPLGMSLSNNDLFVCDDVVKWFDISRGSELVAKGIINERANDAIVNGNILMLVGENGLSQYDFSGPEPKLLSRIKMK
jgi:hypothetical protein